MVEFMVKCCRRDYLVRPWRHLFIAHGEFDVCWLAPAVHPWWPND